MYFISQTAKSAAGNGACTSEASVGETSENSGKSERKIRVVLSSSSGSEAEELAQR